MADQENVLNFQIQGMDCAGCAQSIVTAVEQLEGVRQCDLNFTTAKLKITGAAPATAIMDKVQALGYAIAPLEAQQPAAAPTEELPNFWHYLWQRRTTQFALLGILLILPGLFWEELLGQSMPWTTATSLLALAAAGWPVARSAWRALTINREVNINVLMTIAALGAVVIGAYTEAGMVMVLFALSEALEGYIGNRARHAIHSLLSAAPAEATLISTSKGSRSEGNPANADRHLTTVPVNTLAIGDRILVKPGERIAMDGMVCAGRSAVNQAAITGESMPLDKAQDDTVFAGSINGEGVLEIEVTHLAADNTISRMIRLVEEAQEKRAPVQRFVDQFARWYTPTVVVLAALVATLPPLFFGQPFWNPAPESFGWLYRGLALLVVACPCALVISTPVSIISAITNAARHGVLFKGGAFVEQLSKVCAIALDKTGTLTAGAPTVVNIRTVDCSEQAPTVHGACLACDDLLALAGALEQQSEHPLARAIVNASTQRGLTHRYTAVEQVKALTGRGVTGLVDGRQVLIGSHSYFDHAVAHSAEQCQAAGNDAAQGHTPMFVSVDGAYRGVIAVADTVRQSSRAAVAALKATGITDVVMLTGDNQATAQSIAQQVGVTDVQAELLPADKLSVIQTLQATHGAVAMVGDGINDAPALAAADVGIAIGGANGTAQAMETADITLMRADLAQLPFAVKLSRAAMQTIRANVILSIAIKVLFLLIVLLGWGTMWMAVLADMGTSLLVTFNGMRLLRFSDSASGKI
ncbi:MAG: heavy metal translocating P-type ATPase [Caldilineaceae bacterium]